ncbi:MAG: hypothetical protein K2O78_05260, partial [Muribaculaceae bacterium]|nr:hypothetical protein [Muribaculaceae bacterium]
MERNKDQNPGADNTYCRESFIFYRSFYEAIRPLPRDVQAEVYTAIMEYALYGTPPQDPKPITASVFALVKPLIDRNTARFLNGRKGGRTPAPRPEKAAPARASTTRAPRPKTAT